MKKVFYVFSLMLVCAIAMAQTADNAATGSAVVLSSAGRTSCDYVQLWKDGPKWAMFNVGATITDYAQLQDSIDPVPFNKDRSYPYYNTANIGGLYAWQGPKLNGRKTKWTKTDTNVNDVATALWGSNWETPTKEQFEALLDTTLTTWTMCDGSETQYVTGCALKGYKVSGKGDYADYSIFLPAAGFFNTGFDQIDNTSYYGNYWANTVYDSNHAYKLYFYTNDVSSDYKLSYQGFLYGLSVRAILVERPSAIVTPIEDNQPIVTPTDNGVTITWPITDGADTYSVVIKKGSDVVRTLTFNADGQLDQITYNAPHRDGAFYVPAATATAQGYQFTISGLNPGTAYDYSVTATDAGGKTLAEHKGNFSTTGGTGLNTLPYKGKDGIGSKYFHNGNLIIERNGVKYTSTGQKVR